MRRLNFVLGVFISLAVFTGCNSNEMADKAAEIHNDAALTSLKKSPAIWADCEMFATKGTNTSFKNGPFDELYNGANFANGLGAISESKPGDMDFNGGRWHVNTLKAGVDPNKYINACSVEDLDLNDFESTDVYFECPLLPLRGNSSN